MPTEAFIQHALNSTEQYLRAMEAGHDPMVFDARTFWEGFQVGALALTRAMADAFIKKRFGKTPPQTFTPPSRVQ